MTIGTVEAFAAEAKVAVVVKASASVATALVGSRRSRGGKGGRGSGSNKRREAATEQYPCNTSEKKNNCNMVLG